MWLFLKKGRSFLELGSGELHTQTRGPDPCSEPLQWSRPGMLRSIFRSVDGGIFQGRCIVNKAWQLIRSDRGEGGPKTDSHGWMVEMKAKDRRGLGRKMVMAALDASCLRSLWALHRASWLCSSGLRGLRIGDGYLVMVMPEFVWSVEGRGQWGGSGRAVGCAAPWPMCGLRVCFFSLPPSLPSHLTLPFRPSLSCVILGNLETRPHVFNLQNYILQWAGKGLSGIILLKICGFSPWNDLPEIIPFLSL